jgi:hypothetical protein
MRTEDVSSDGMTFGPVSMHYPPPALYNRSQGSYEEIFQRRSLKEEKVEIIPRIVEDKLIYTEMVFLSTGK